MSGTGLEGRMFRATKAASDLARYVTGAAPAVDGGFTVGTHTAALSTS